MPTINRVVTLLAVILVTILVVTPTFDTFSNWGRQSFEFQIIVPWARDAIRLFSVLIPGRPNGTYVAWSGLLTPFNLAYLIYRFSPSLIAIVAATYWGAFSRESRFPAAIPAACFVALLLRSVWQSDHLRISFSLWLALELITVAAAVMTIVYLKKPAHRVPNRIARKDGVR